MAPPLDGAGAASWGVLVGSRGQLRVGDGRSSRALFGSLALQAVVVTLLAAALVMVLSNFMGGLFKQPVAIPGSAFATLPAIAVAVGLIASLVALRRATGADPAAAFGG